MNSRAQVSEADTKTLLSEIARRIAEERDLEAELGVQVMAERITQARAILSTPAPRKEQTK